MSDIKIFRALSQTYISVAKQEESIIIIFCDPDSEEPICPTWLKDFVTMFSDGDYDFLSCDWISDGWEANIQDGQILIAPNNNQQDLCIQIELVFGWAKKAAMKVAAESMSVTFFESISDDRKSRGASIVFDIKQYLSEFIMKDIKEEAALIKGYTLRLDEPMGIIDIVPENDIGEIPLETVIDLILETVYEYPKHEK